MDDLKYLYFSSADGIFAFGIVPLLWIGSLFVARINRLQIIKSVLFLLMYGHFILYSIISLTIIDAEKSAENTLLVLLERICGFLLFLAPVLWLVLFFWSIEGLVLLIRRKLKSEKAQKLKEDFAARTGLQILLLLLIVFGWWESMKQLFHGFGA
jgi:hypothetical protein